MLRLSVNRNLPARSSSTTAISHPAFYNFAYLIFGQDYAKLSDGGVVAAFPEPPFATTWATQFVGYSLLFDQTGKGRDNLLVVF